MVTRVQDVSEVRLVNCAADQIAVDFSPKGFVDVEGGPQTVSVSELEVLRLISLETYDKITAQPCDPRCK